MLLRGLGVFPAVNPADAYKQMLDQGPWGGHRRPQSTGIRRTAAVAGLRHLSQWSARSNTLGSAGDPSARPAVHSRLRARRACNLFRQVALDAAPQPLPLETALSTLASARAVFDATRLWQRDMYEHYSSAAGHRRGRPCKGRWLGARTTCYPKN